MEDLLSDVIWSITEVGDQVWVTTENGLKMYNKDLEVTRYGPKDGVKSSNFFSNAAYADSEGHVWWGGSRGLLEYTLTESIAKQEPLEIFWTSLIVDNKTIAISPVRFQ